MTTKFDEAIRLLEEVFQGENTTISHHDQTKKVFILVASGRLAEPYQNAVKAVQELSQAQSRIETDRIISGLNQQQKK